MNIDYRGIPSSVCPECNGSRFLTWIVINPEDYEIGMYGIDGECFECHTKYTIGTPIDSPDRIEMDMENDEY